MHRYLRAPEKMVTLEISGAVAANPGIFSKPLGQAYHDLQDERFLFILRCPPSPLSPFRLVSPRRCCLWR